MRVWITRTLPGAQRTAAAVAARGWQPVVEPLLEVRFLRPSIDLTGVAALAFTSAHGVDALAASETRRDLPVFAVGDATAQAARKTGFERVDSATGDVAALARLIAARRPDGVVLHAAASEPAGDLVAALAGAGVTARLLAVYETVERAWTEPDCDAVLVQSPRAARALADRLDPTLPRLYACVSEPAAAPLRAAGFRYVESAPEPTEAATLALLSPGLGKPSPGV